MQTLKQWLVIIGALAVLFKITYSKAADDVFIVNGKRVDATSAYFAGTNSKNEVLKCQLVNVQIDTKGNGKLKRRDTGWAPISK